MSVLTREEFGRLVSEYGRAVQWQDVEGEGRRVAEAYDAALARIAELESPAHRARIAREFLGELTFRYTDIDLDKSAFDCFLAVLDEWEAAAKEGK